MPPDPAATTPAGSPAVALLRACVCRNCNDQKTSCTRATALPCERVYGTPGALCSIDAEISRSPACSAVCPCSGDAAPATSVLFQVHHAFRNVTDEPMSMLMLFSPGAPREEYFARVAEMAKRGSDQPKEFRVRHDSYFEEDFGPGAR